MANKPYDWNRSAARRQRRQKLLDDLKTAGAWLLLAGCVALLMYWTATA